MPRYQFRTRRIEVWIYEVDLPEPLTEAGLAASTGDEWDVIIADAEMDCREEEEEYVPDSLRELS